MTQSCGENGVGVCAYNSSGIDGMKIGEGKKGQKTKNETDE